MWYFTKFSFTLFNAKKITFNLKSCLVTVKRCLPRLHLRQNTVLTKALNIAEKPKFHSSQIESEIYRNTMMQPSDHTSAAKEQPLWLVHTWKQEHYSFKKQNRPQGPYSLECRRLIWCRTLALHLFPIALPGQSRIPFNVMLNFLYHSTFTKIKR